MTKLVGAAGGAVTVADGGALAAGPGAAVGLPLPPPHAESVTTRVSAQNDVFIVSTRLSKRN